MKPSREELLKNKAPEGRRNARILHFSGKAPVLVRQKQDFFQQRKKFLSAKTEISCRKAIFRSAENRKKGGFGRLFRSRWNAEADKIKMTDCRPWHHTADTAKDSVRPERVPGCQEATGKGKPASGRFGTSPRKSHISARPRQPARTRHPRDAALDNLTLCQDTLLPFLPAISIHSQPCSRRRRRTSSRWEM